MTTPSRKRPWYLRLPGHLPSSVAVLSRAADVPDGFTRQVQVTYSMDEPGKGGTEPPRREVLAYYNPRDAIRMAIRLLTNATQAQRQNRQHGNGGDYADAWPADPGDPGRRMDHGVATELELLTRLVVQQLEAWEEDHPQVADARISNALHGLRTADRMLGYLRDDTYPELDAARARLAESGFFDGEPADGEQPGDATPDA